MEKPKDLTTETYYRALQMLNSNDNDDRILSLSCIDQLDMDNNLLYIMLLKRHGRSHHTMWERHAPIAYNRLKQEGVEVDGMLQFHDILNIITKHSSRNRITLESLQYTLEMAAFFIKEQLVTLSPVLLKDLEVKIKIKQDDQQTRRIGEGEQGLDAKGSILRDVSDNAEQAVH